MKRCPTCKQSIPDSLVIPPVRVCADCGKQILRGHKFIFFNDNGLTSIKHRHCDDPYVYKTKKEKEQSALPLFPDER